MAHFFKSIPRLQKNFSVNCPSSGVLVHLTLQKTIAIFLKYSVQKSSIVDELAPLFLTIRTNIYLNQDKALL